MTDQPRSLRAFAIAVVREPVPARKVELARQAARDWQAGALPAILSPTKPVFPTFPGRPDKPELRSFRDMPRRRPGSKSGLVALVHSLAHIELNALDMSFDLVARFCHLELPRSFLDGAVRVGLEEARHFEMINERLQELGAGYGDLPAHGGLWEATRNTRHDVLARLAIVPLVLEARGLDVSPAMIEQVRKAGETATAASMEIIYRDEITHVAFGARWFKYICEQQGLDPTTRFQSLVQKYFKGPLKPPFNEEARQMAGLSPDFYLPLVR